MSDSDSKRVLLFASYGIFRGGRCANYSSEYDASGASDFRAPVGQVEFDSDVLCVRDGGLRYAYIGGGVHYKGDGEGDTVTMPVFKVNARELAALDGIEDVASGHYCRMLAHVDGVQIYFYAKNFSDSFPRAGEMVHDCLDLIWRNYPNLLAKHLPLFGRVDSFSALRLCKHYYDNGAVGANVIARFNVAGGKCLPDWLVQSPAARRHYSADYVEAARRRGGWQSNFTRDDYRRQSAAFPALPLVNRRGGGTVTKPKARSAKRIYYLAYGSNLVKARMLSRCPSARVEKTVKIEGARLAFDTHADIEITRRRRDVLLGVVYSILDDELGALKAAESSYDLVHDILDVELPSGENVKAFSFLKSSVRRVRLAPSREYLAMLVNGYLKFFPGAAAMRKLLSAARRAGWHGELPPPAKNKACVDLFGGGRIGSWRGGRGRRYGGDWRAFWSPDLEDGVIK